MGDKRSYAALEWVVGEIGESLKQARQALEAYVDNPEDTTRVRFCLTHIHQVHGSLQMVEFYGAALLAEEMENLAQALMNQSVRNDGEAQEVLMRAILQLPVYLDQVKLTRRDYPSVVLPLLNDLRAVRGESLLTETKLFTPNLAAAHHIADRNAAAALDPQQFLVIVHKLRQMYQYAAAGVIRGVKRDENIAYLHKVFGRLRKLTKGTARQPLWDISLALLEGLEHESIESSATVKNLLRQLDKEIKVLVDGGVAALNTFTHDDLIKNLLYYVAQASHNGNYIERVKQAYRLETALPKTGSQGDDEAMAPDLDAMRSVVDALKDELDAIKQALDISLTGRDTADVRQALPIIKRVADTMAVLGIGELRKQVLAQGELLESVADQDPIPTDVLMTVAGKVIDIESELELMARGGASGSAGSGSSVSALDQAQESVLRESRNGLEQAKDAIIEYIASQWNREHLANVPKHLRDISGSLEMVPLQKPGAILRACANYIQQQLLEKAATPDWSTLDTLADAIASVEYYLERLTGDREEEDELLLSVAEDSVEALGYPLAVHLRSPRLRHSRDVSLRGTGEQETECGQADTGTLLEKVAYTEAVEIATVPAGEDEPTYDPALAGVGLDACSPSEAAELSTSGEPASAEPASPKLASDPLVDIATGNKLDKHLVGAGRACPPSETLAVQETRVVQESITRPETEITTAPESGTAIASEHETTMTPEPGATIAAENDDLIDDEILEIFIEEAQEVLETIKEFFPRWAADFEDGEALTEFRRAFHTLKGSGRMVTANDIGELAWAVEDMLNHIIDHTVEPNDGHVVLIQKAVALLPSMVNAFQHRQPNPHPSLTDNLAQWAQALSRGEHPDGLFTDETLTDETLTDETFADETFGDETFSVETFSDATFEDESGDETFSDAISRDATSGDATANASFSDAASANATSADPTVCGDDDDEADDSMLWDIFGSEAITHLEVVQEYIAEMTESAPLFTPPSDQMQRALHTLKGSAHMADVKPIADLVAPLERFVKELRIYQVNIDYDILQLLKDGVEYIQLVLVQIENKEVQEIPRLAQYLARVAELKERSVAPLIRQKEAQEENAKQTVDPALLSIFMAEEMKLLLDVDKIILGWQTHSFDPGEAEPVTAELATLERGSEHANLPPMATLSRQLRQLYEAALNHKLTPDRAFYQVLLDGHAELLDMVDAVAVGQNLLPISEDVQIRLANLISIADDVVSTIPSLKPDSDIPDVVAEVGADLRVCPENSDIPYIVAEEDNSRDVEEVDLEIFEIFIEEAEELLEEIDEAVHDWEEDWSDSSHVEALKRALHTLKGGARLAGLMGLGELAHEFESYLIAKGENVDVDQAFFEVVHQYQDKLISGTDKIKTRVAGHVPEGLEEMLEASEHAGEQVLEQPIASMPETADDMDLASSGEAPAVEDEALANHDSSSAHDYLSPDSSSQGKSSQDKSSQDKLSQDTSSEEKVSRERPSLEASSQVKSSQVKFPQEASTGERAIPENASADILPFAPKSKGPDRSADKAHPPASREFAGPTSGAAAGSSMAARRSGPQEVIKVSAELLEELVNLAGETSISRGRLEEQNTELTFAIDEMESTVHRLQEQLRRLDIETEAQMIFRQEQMEVAEEFDPLEMDRYSQLQQLSRSLMESASDLMDLTTTLNDKTRGTETLLLQQSRINTDLQEGLMRSRMVPFSRMVPRLRRIVRQISMELGKQVSFELDNVEGELDRSVLERMVAPLEHMLRNAVDHGIEDREERLRTGKPETGRILLSLGREGGDVLMRLADDGRGLNLERIREKAIERGLMNREAQLSDQDIMQFIVQAGFSTADKITQISGRGVGMDVVHAEIKQLGGSMHIDSRWGEGTEFVIRLPFTVSVNRALMIQLGEDNYAIPLNTIEGIVRVSPFELEHYYQDENARFEYAGENYRVRYLGAMLERDNLPRLEGLMLPMPVVLVRTAEHTVAIQVDKLMGSREIVVKSLGPQFSAVEGLSGATVMGDGSVVVILDPTAIIRKEMALLTPGAKSREVTPIAAEKRERRAQLVLVVDDSVTVRKVTSRFLEREGYEVMTAKDGSDALLTLQDHVPDLMLLDIEMPRMDGFEVAKNVRSSSRLRKIPIIMITSRTGEKHRERAFTLGVNKYLGKPYQEELLLSNIHELIGAPAEL